MDVLRNPGFWTVELFAAATHPEPVQWPTTEAWFDSYLIPPVTEFTVHKPIAEIAFAWGYLAARKGVKRPIVEALSHV